MYSQVDGIPLRRLPLHSEDPPGPALKTIKMMMNTRIAIIIFIRMDMEIPSLVIVHAHGETITIIIKAMKTTARWIMMIVLFLLPLEASCPWPPFQPVTVAMCFM